MKFFRKLTLKTVISGMLFFAAIILYFWLTGGDILTNGDNSPDCEDCAKKKAKTYMGEDNSNGNNTKNGESNYFFKIFSLLTTSDDGEGTDTIIESDPEHDKAVNKINSLSKNVCNGENLPEDIWISTKLMEKDADSHVKELEKLIGYCSGLKNGKITAEEKRDYYRIKIRLLEERRELIKYYIETLDGQIEDTNEKKIADMENRKAGDKISAEEEKINTEIETETNRFYDEAVVNTGKVIDKIDSIIKNYKIELSKL